MDAPVAVAVFVVAMLYSAVGHGGASGYLAILSLAKMDPASMSSSALLLNIIVASMSVVAYARAGHLHWKQAAPFVYLSVPAAFLGGLTPISPQIYSLLLAFALGFSAYRLAFCSKQILGDGEINTPSYAVALPIGAILGWISGMIGIGGGIFLSPVILFKRWATAQQTSAIAAFFIVVNSLSGIVGRLLNHSFTAYSSAPLLLAAVLGGLIGSHLGARVLTRPAICKVLATVLTLAIAKLVMVAAH